jgi:hypothetical protein
MLETHCIFCEVRTVFLYIVTAVTSKYGDLALQVGGVSDETVK